MIILFLCIVMKLCFLVEIFFYRKCMAVRFVIVNVTFDS